MAYPNVDANQGQMIYNNPHWDVQGGNQVVQKDKSSIGEQIRLDVFIRQAMEELAKERVFTQMSGVYNLPLHSGKKIKKFHYLPVLDDRNVNSQGIDAEGKVGSAGNNKNGNFYGGSKDVKTIQGKLPSLTEVGGRVNRIGFTRTTLEGTVSRLGFFYEFTKESLDFDSDPMLIKHMGREALRGAYEIQEDMIAIELINGAGIKIFGGSATSLSTMTAENVGQESVVTYEQLQRLAVTLKENRAPNRIKASTGTRIIDSKIVGAGYVLYCGYPMENMFRNMKNSDNEKVFIPVEKYAAGTTTLNGEIGTVGSFRIVVAPEMPEYIGAGAEDVGKDNTMYRKSAGSTDNGYGNTTASNDYYDVFPMLVVASEAFTCLGFQADMGGKGNFKMITKLPGTETADRMDPYGQSGFTSIQWTHGMLIERPEWIAVLHSVAKI